MAGLYGVYSIKKSIRRNLYNFFYSSNSEEIINEEFESENFIYGRSVLPKFLEDRVLYEDESLIVGFEGVSFSAKKGNLIKYITENYKNSELDFLQNIEGFFSGFICDKKSKKLHVFTDHLSTKPLYYYYSKEAKQFIFSSELKMISQYLRLNKVGITLNEDALRCLLTFGYMLGDLTPVAEVKKIKPGTILSFDFLEFEIEEKEYCSLSGLIESDLDKTQIINEIDRLITHATNQEWQKDKEYGYDHFAFLSGGLDSRVNVMLASELGYKDISVLTFSEKNTLDEKIAKKITSDLGLNHLFVELSSGKYLEENLEEFVQANDGLAILYGSAHQQSALEKLDLQRIGLGHTGQIGDALFGSLSGLETPSKALKKLSYNFDSVIVSKIDAWNNLLENQFYGDSLEVFAYKNRVINGTMNGDRSSSHIIDSISPFYNKELFNFCLKIPGKYKVKARLYLDWMKEKHPQLQRYVWQKTGTLPKKNIYREALYFKNRLYRYVLRKIGIQKENMNPFQTWYENNSKIRTTLDQLFESHLNLIEDNDLKKDIERVFDSESAMVKYNALTVLLSVKLHFHS